MAETSTTRTDHHVVFRAQGNICTATKFYLSDGYQAAKVIGEACPELDLILIEVVK